MIRSRSLLAILQIFFLLGFLSPSSAAEAKRMGKVEGESHVNLRSGPDLRHPPIAVLKKGDVVTVEEESQNWYRVSLAGGQRGYVHRTLLTVIRDPEGIEPPEEAKETPRAATPEPALRPFSRIEPSEAFPLSRLNGLGLVEGLAGVVCFFFLGWIFGGNYYLRRDRNRISRLRL